jgi:hypothetical protein
VVGNKLAQEINSGMNTKETSRPQAGRCAWGILFNFEAGGDIKSRQNFNVDPKIKPEGHQIKKLLTLIVGLVMMSSLAVANAQPPNFGDSEIGIFVVTNPADENAQEQACYMGPPGQFTAYVVLTNPVNQHNGNPMAQVGGFEFRLVYPSGTFVTPTLHPSATNFMSPPDFLCGAQIPVVGGQCTLITLTIVTFSADPIHWYIHPISDAGSQSIPGSIAISDALDDFSLSEAYVVSGDFTVPVFGMYDCGDVVPNENTSWGGIKSLYR